MAPIEASTHAARSAFCWLGVTPGLTRTVGPLALHPARMLTTKRPGLIPPLDLRMGRDPFGGRGVSTACPSSPLPSGERGPDRARGIGGGLEEGRAERRRPRRREA